MTRSQYPSVSTTFGLPTRTTDQIAALAPSIATTTPRLPVNSATRAATVVREAIKTPTTAPTSVLTEDSLRGSPRS
ncbi:MAG TPA: hypothetical protein VFI53_04845 [Myxococcaceae bacterium]|nr:hypothetical protein [Myxococcaceae bacterium]